MNSKTIRAKRGSRKVSGLSTRTKVLVKILLALVGIIVIFVVYLAATGQLNKNADSLGGKLLSLTGGTAFHLTQSNVNANNTFNAIEGMKGTCAYRDDPAHACAAAVSLALMNAGVVNRFYTVAQTLIENLKNYAGYHATVKPINGDVVAFYSCDAKGNVSSTTHHVGIVHVNANGSINVIGNGSTSGVVNEQPIGIFQTPAGGGYCAYTFYHQGR